MIKICIGLYFVSCSLGFSTDDFGTLLLEGFTALLSSDMDTSLLYNFNPPESESKSVSLTQQVAWLRWNRRWLVKQAIRTSHWLQNLRSTGNFNGNYTTQSRLSSLSDQLRSIANNSKIKSDREPINTERILFEENKLLARNLLSIFLEIFELTEQPIFRQAADVYGRSDLFCAIEELDYRFHVYEDDTLDPWTDPDSFKN